MADTHPPFYKTLGEIGALWAAAEVGYRIVLPLLGSSISYNESPVAITLYYGFWVLVSIIAFRDTLLKHIQVERLWLNGVVSLGFGMFVFVALYGFSLLPVPSGETMVPYTDILFASPWYFLPKAMDILVQQTLIAILVYAIAAQFHSMRRVSSAYAIIFGGTHVLTFIMSGAPTPYAAIMTLGSLASAAIFPFLILRTKNGFVYTYMIHLGFYLALALALHAWPPPDYS